MKIKFENGKEYEVMSVCCQMDGNGVPIDIVIVGIKDVLNKIAEEQCIIGYSLNHLTLGMEKEILYEALYGRLSTFTCDNYQQVHYTDDMVEYIKNNY